MGVGTLFFLGLTLAIYLPSGVHTATFTIKNHCPYTIWPATLTGSGPLFPTTGFELASEASNSFSVPSPWSGRIWSRFVCSNSSKKFSCLSGDCASGQIPCNGAGGIPPTTLIEFTLATNGGKDFYDISLVDGFNLPVSVIPQGGSNCSTVSCAVDINAFCPPSLAIKNPSDGGIIGCKSACLAFNQPQYCCTGPYSTPDKCKPTAYSNFFKKRCHQTYSYAFDDKTSLFSCFGGTDYLITFCP